MPDHATVMHANFACMVQEGLKSVKAKHGDRIHLRKSSGTANPPFPVHVSIANETDVPGHTHYDQLEGLKVRVSVSSSVLKDFGGNVEDMMEVSFVSNQLPQSLTQKMQDRIPSLLSFGFPSQVNAVPFVIQTVDLIATRLSEVLPELLSLLPLCMETYESIGPGGDSERRIKFIDVESPPAAVEATPSSSTTSNGSRVQDEIAVRCSPQDAAEHADAPCTLSKTIQGLVARFPDLRITSSKLQPDSGVLQSVAFVVSILPSDPDWQHEALHLSGTVAMIDRRRSNQIHASISDQSSHRPMSQRAAEHSTSSSAKSCPQRGMQKEPRPAIAPQARGEGTATVLKLEPSHLTDAVACAMVNQMLKKQAELHVGAQEPGVDQSILVAGLHVLFKPICDCRQARFPTLHAQVG